MNDLTCRNSYKCTVFTVLVATMYMGFHTLSLPAVMIVHTQLMRHGISLVSLQGLPLPLAHQGCLPSQKRTPGMYMQ